MPGPVIRSDIVDVYVFRQVQRGRSSSTQFLQMRRVNKPMAGTWQPVMGHVEEDETATQTALRELREETGYQPGQGLLGFWQLESLNTYFLAALDTIVLGPCFAALVEAEREPTLDDSHDALRWVPRDAADLHFIWPGQRVAIEQIFRDILAPHSPAERILRINIGI